MNIGILRSQGSIGPHGKKGMFCRMPTFLTLLSQLKCPFINMEETTENGTVITIASAWIESEPDRYFRIGSSQTPNQHRRPEVDPDKRPPLENAIPVAASLQNHLHSRTVFEHVFESDAVAKPL